MFFHSLKKFRYLFSPEESDVYLFVGVAALFAGISMIYLPAALITIGLIFIIIAYLEAQKEGLNDGSS